MDFRLALSLVLILFVQTTAQGQTESYRDSLSQGLQTIFYPDTSRPQVELTLVLTSGEDQESEGIDGVNVLLNQLFWDRGKDSLNYRRYAMRRGIFTDAWYRGNTHYFYLRCLPELVPNALRILQAALSDDFYPSEYIQRKVTDYAQVLQARISDPVFGLHQQVQRNLWGDQFAAANANGEFADMRTLQPASLRKFHQGFLIPQNSFLMGTGNLSEEKWSTLVSESMSIWFPGTGSVANPGFLSGFVFRPQVQERLVINDLILAPRIEFAWDVRGQNAEYCRHFVRVANSPDGPYAQTLLGDSLATAFQWRYENYPGSLTLWVEPLPDRIQRCGNAVPGIMEQIKETPELWTNLATEIGTQKAFEKQVAFDRFPLWVTQWPEFEATSAPEADQMDYFVEMISSTPADASALMVNSEMARRVKADDVLGPLVLVTVNIDSMPMDTLDFIDIDTLPYLPDYTWLDSIRVYFNSGSFEPDVPSMLGIERVVDLLQQDDSLRVHVNGYTDGLGDGVTNYALSIQRAEAVRDILRDRFQVAEDRLVVVGWGEAFPEYPDDTPRHRALNRRVTFDIVSDETNY